MLRLGRSYYVTALLAACVAFSASPAGAIVGGYETDDAEFKARFSSIFSVRATGDSENWNCAGVYVGEKKIITAAHCVTEDKEQKVLAPTAIELSGGSMEWQAGAATPIESVHVHPSFGKETALDGDLAVLILKAEPVGIQAASIPSSLVDEYPKNTLGVVAGWGTTEFGDDHSEILRWTPLSSIEQSDCQEDMKKKLTGAMFCATAPYDAPNARGIGEGDSGGPFLIESEGGAAPSVVGISSWSSSDNYLLGAPSVFVNVSHFSDWVKSIAGPE